MGCRVASFLLLLLLIGSCGAASAARHSSFVVFDVEVIEVKDTSSTFNEQILASKIPVPVERGNPLCSACENFTNKSISYLNEKQTQDKIVETLHEACSQTFSLLQQCTELVDSYATLLFAKIGEIKPDELCKEYGLCRNMGLQSAVKGSDSTCVFCHHIMDEIVSKLKDPDAEFEIVQILLKECNKVEGHVQQCKRMVLQYIPLILVNGEKFLEKNDVCTLIQACDASKRRTFSSFFAQNLVRDA